MKFKPMYKSKQFLCSNVEALGQRVERNGMTYGMTRWV